MTIGLTGHLTKALAHLRLLSALLLLQLAAHAPNVYAQAHYVYRYSSAPPAEVFANGFQALGSDLNLVSYARASGSMTGFVTTSASYRNAQEHAHVSLQYAPMGRLWGYIYTISADNTFYDLNMSVRRFFQQENQAGTVEPRRRALMQSIGLVLPLETSEHFVTPNAIPSEMIRSSVRVRLVRGSDGRFQLEEGERRDNPNWIGYEDSRVTNPDPYATTWPDDDVAASPGRCTPPIGEIDEGGATGGNCTGVYAVAAEGTGGIEQALRYYSPFDFADCSSSSSRREKRDSNAVICPRLRLTNLSRLMGVLSIMSPDV